MATDTESCSDCGQGIMLGQGNPGAGDTVVCGGCASDHTPCADCQTVARRDDMTAAQGDRLLCESCMENYGTCSDCETIAAIDDMASTDSDGIICESCRDARYVWSEPQDCYISENGARHLSDTDEYVSPQYARRNCYYCESDDSWYSDSDNAPSSEDDYGNGCLLDYSTDVLECCQHDSRALRKGALMFGVELEMEPRGHSTQSDVAAALGGKQTAKYILKDDGSLSSGVELVTIPMTLEQHRANFGWEATLAPVLTRAKSGAGTTHCGMHVHVNKAALTPLQIGKILVFMNSPKLARNISTIAQRESNGYCERSHKKVTDGKGQSDSRYDIANVGGRTVEFRLFRGNLRFARVLKNLEFCHAVVTYCGDASMLVLEDWSAFAAWLLARRGQYSELVKFLSGQKAAGFESATRARKDAPVTTLEDC